VQVLPLIVIFATFVLWFKRASVAWFGGLVMLGTRSAFFAAAAVVSFTSASLAADMPIKAPVTPVLLNWTGYYAGISVGGIWQSDTIDPQVSGTPGPNSTPTQAAIARQLDTKSRAGIIGGQLGYNYQFNQRWVCGIETDISWTNLDGSDSVTNSFLIGRGPRLITTSAEQKLNWLGTARIRIGYLPVNNTLVYATGGAAYGGASSMLNVSGAGFLTFSNSANASDVLLGWTVGGGFEWAFDKDWSFKGEYLYYDLGSQNLYITRPNAPPPGFNVSADASFRGSIARVGFNYKFAPVH
jgi:outer membrane immunogenic protein